MAFTMSLNLSNLALAVVAGVVSLALLVFFGWPYRETK